MLTHPQFDPVALQIGPLALRWYGLMYLAAFTLFFLLGRWRLSQPRFAQASGLSVRDLEDVLFHGALGVVLGGRLGYVLFYKPAYYLAHPLEILAVWQGGMAFHGGVFAGLLTLALALAGLRPPVPVAAILGRLGGLGGLCGMGLL
ncbi:MAG TPA: prolipoprotein diacylglyceryl transferase, partial [Quisquiliibacterium sp.]|nr:prolipoprotein diacylglyceryl transferase [Quisquiliibacterium sp.]